MVRVTLTHTEIQEALRQAALQKMGRIAGKLAQPITIERMTHAPCDQYMKAHVELEP